MMKEGPNPGESKDTGDDLQRLAEQVALDEERFAEARKCYANLQERASHLRAKIGASGLPRKDIANTATSRELDDVEAEISVLDREFFAASARHALNVDKMEEGIRCRLN